MRETAVVLLSGGIDSTTCLGIALNAGFDVIPATFDYGQRHEVELASARRIREHYGLARAMQISLPILSELGGSSLTDRRIAIPVANEGRGSSEIPSTYVPSRNLVFLSIGAAIAEAMGTGHIFFGATAVDYSGYPDCRPDFIAAFERAANLGSARGIHQRSVQIHAPLVSLSKADIIRLGLMLGVPYQLTHSCYNPVGGAASCGACDACSIRLRGFKEVGVTDPIEYVSLPGQSCQLGDRGNE